MRRVALTSMVTLMALIPVTASAHASTPAAGRCAVAGFAPHSVITGLDPVSVRFSVQASGCTPATWQLAVERQPVASASAPTAPLQPRSMHNRDAGDYNISVWVAGRSGGTALRDFPGGFRILRATTWARGSTTVGMAVEGRPVTLRSTLRRADWEQHQYTALGGAVAQVQFRAHGTKGWRSVGTVRTTSGGTASATVHPTTSGDWRLAFLGNRTTAGSVGPTRSVTVTPLVTATRIVNGPVA